MRRFEITDQLVETAAQALPSGTTYVRWQGLPDSTKESLRKAAERMLVAIGGSR